MTKHLHRIGSQSLFGVLLLALVVSFGASGLLATPVAASEPAPDKATAKFEVKFMQDMIDHHAMAVMTAEMCVEKATHEELRQLCENIIAAQSDEIQKMQTWLADWYGVHYEPRMKRGEMRQMEKLASLSGAEFEIAFMEMIIRHHERAIKEAETCIERAYHDELVSLCENIVETQSAEIEQMQTWLCEWYGICKEREE